VLTVSLDHVDHIRREASLLRAALASADPSAAVPSCPGWHADDLLRHVSVVLGFWATVVEGRLTTPPAAGQPSPAAHRPELLDHYDHQVARLVRLLQDAPADTVVWTWSDDRTVGFVRLRVAHETLIHRLDAELTAGAVTPVDAHLATDGVDEVLRNFFGGAAGAQFRRRGPLGSLRTLDTGADWVVELGDVTGPTRDGRSHQDLQPGFRIAEATAQAPESTFTISASAVDLDAWLWRRPVGSDIAIDGDPDAAARFTAIITEGIR
jgi:uncharacterized protein (TIGR03083 family)